MEITTLCECGCGQPAPIAQRSNSKLGHIKGEPVRFIRGHHNKIRPLRPVEERFWEKVDRRGPLECWNWTGCKDKLGYGFLNIGNHKIERAYRVSYEMHIRPIPDGKSVCHSCDNPSCVNPAHLFVGTHTENLADMRAKGRDSKPPRNDVNGENNGHAQFTNAQVREFRRQFAEMNVSVTAFATFHEVPLMTMWQIIHNKTYKNA